MGGFQNLFVDVVNMSITASYVIILVLIARLFLKRAPRIFSYCLWIVVLFRLVCPFSFSSAFSFLQMAGANPGKLEYIPSNIEMMAQPQINTGINSVNAAVNSSLPAATPFASANPMQIILSVLTVIWIVGIVSLLLYSVIAYLRLKYRVRTAMLVEDNLWESEEISSPFVLGMIKPKIYLPIGLNDMQRFHIQKHEETHIRRRDYLIKPIAFLTLCIHWFNPLVWISFILMSKDMEMSCDERVLKELGTDAKKDYSTSLLSLAANRRIIIAGPLAFGESNVKARIKNVLNYRQPAFWMVIAAAIAVVCVGVGLISNPQSASTGESDSIQEIYQYRTPYLGDNSNVVHIADRLPVPKTLTRTKVRLFTDKAPYMVEINYKTTPTVREAFVKPDNQTIFDQNAVLMFALIGNTESVKFVLNDGQQDLSIERTRAWANGKMAKNVWESASTIEKFTALNGDLMNRFVPPASLAELLVSGKKTNIQSINDVPDVDGYKKAEVYDEVYYIYEKNGKYYVEKPYQSVDEITSESYYKIIQACSDDTNVNMLVPPRISITTAGTEIDYVVGLNQWNNAIYDREGTFQTIMRGKTKADLPYIKLNREFQIAFKGTAPDSAKLEDYILQPNGNARYSAREVQTIPIEFNDGKGSFVLAANPAAFLSSASSDYEPGASIRGFRLTCNWGKNECEYAFIIRSDAGHL
jgi:beta-lactamase regulating signal transducer with metallopeptidase domain